MTNITLIEGDLENFGGYALNGVEHVGEQEEALVNEARQMAYALGQTVESALERLL